MSSIFCTRNVCGSCWIFFKLQVRVCVEVVLLIKTKIYQLFMVFFVCFYCGLRYGNMRVTDSQKEKKMGSIGTVIEFLTFVLVSPLKEPLRHL